MENLAKRLNKMCNFMLKNLEISVVHRKNSKFNKCRAFNKAVGPGKKSKINKRRAHVYSGL